jgi:hypothetical protein
MLSNLTLKPGSFRALMIAFSSARRCVSEIVVYVYAMIMGYEDVHIFWFQ